MKTITLLMLVIGIAAPGLVSAQQKPVSAKQTVVTSDSFSLDMTAKQGTFRGNVNSVSPDLKMKSDELIVNFGQNDNKIVSLQARGNVEMETPDRKAKAGKVDYIVAEDKMTLTENPEVIQNQNRITGTVIVISPGKNQMTIDGRSRVILYDDMKTAPK